MVRPEAYRWVVLGISTAINALAWGVRSTFALFYVELLNEFAWDRGSTALGYSLSWLCFVIFAPVAGWLSDRWGPRTIVTAGGLLLGVALALTAQVTSLALYYVWFGFLAAAGTACMIIPSTTIVTRWFLQSRGTAMGILSTGGPASAVVFYPVNAWLIATLGWRAALVAFGSLIAGVAVSLALLYRERPAEEQRPIEHGETQRSRAEDAPTQEWSLRLALRNYRLWAAFIMTALGVIGFQIMATHQVAHAVDRGFRHETVVWLFSFGAACMMAGGLGGAIGPFLGGWLFDVTGSYRLAFAAACAAIAGSALAAWFAARGTSTAAKRRDAHSEIDRPAIT